MYEHYGKLWLLDVVHDTLLAHSRITAWQMSVAFEDEEAVGLAVWHPSSSGIVLPFGFEIKRESSFWQAGIAVGELPEFLFNHAAGFSANAKFTVAWDPEIAMTRAQDRYTLVSCIVDGLDILLTVSQVLVGLSGHDVPRAIAWMPDTCSLFAVLSEDTATWKTLVYQFCPSEQPWPRAAPRHELLSPSSQLFVTTGSYGLTVADVLTGQGYWDQARVISDTWEAASGVTVGCPQALGYFMCLRRTSPMSHPR